jgi:hypothetical protein
VLWFHGSPRGGCATCFGSGYLKVRLSTSQSSRVNVCVLFTVLEPWQWRNWCISVPTCTVFETRWRTWRLHCMWKSLVCVNLLVVGKEWRRAATVTPLCDFYEIRGVCKLGLLSNATCGLAFCRSCSSIFFVPVREMWSPMYIDFGLFLDALMRVICRLVWFSIHRPLCV